MKNSIIVILGLLKKFYSFITNLKSETKTVIIFILLVILLNPIPRYYYESTIKKVLKLLKEDIRLEEEDGFKKAPFIALCIDNIKDKDPDCSNVLLLSYHNTKHSLQGFSYIYLDCIKESINSPEDDYVGDYWQSLLYINYQDELNKISSTACLRVNNIEDIKELFPRLYKKLVLSNALAAAFYPIEGIRNPIGIVAVLYRHPKQFKVGYYPKVIAPLILKLSTLLDDTMYDADEN